MQHFFLDMSLKIRSYFSTIISLFFNANGASVVRLWAGNVLRESASTHGTYMVHIYISKTRYQHATALPWNSTEKHRENRWRGLFRIAVFIAFHRGAFISSQVYARGFLRPHEGTCRHVENVEKEHRGTHLELIFLNKKLYLVTVLLHGHERVPHARTWCEWSPVV